ncbi:MAG: 7-cyano-7-deazaguanine synthase QueC, partial [Candidatus Omnitrophica bacterium]|nr:7-cyano-7-deazaguanine synthase QueC [Candidatus Omnitrophota bacterium]
DYGQRHRRELEAARAIAEQAARPLEVISIRLPWGGSSLLDTDIDIPVRRSPEIMGSQIPSTYVPARNTIFLSFALSYAEAIGAGAIVIGANQVDYSGYPDCRPGYYAAWENLIRTGTVAGVKNPDPVQPAIRIETPLIDLTKAQIIQKGLAWGVPYELTWSCYSGKERPCGVCDSCVLRAKGFSEAGVTDPTFKGVL